RTSEAVEIQIRRPGHGLYRSYGRRPPGTFAPLGPRHRGPASRSFVDDWNSLGGRRPAEEDARRDRREARQTGDSGEWLSLLTSLTAGRPGTRSSRRTGTP